MDEKELAEWFAANKTLLETAYLASEDPGSNRGPASAESAPAWNMFRQNFSPNWSAECSITLSRRVAHC